MIQVIEQTRAEKLAMYMKLSKRELAEMLVNANAALAGAVMHHSSPYQQPASNLPPFAPSHPIMTWGTVLPAVVGGLASTTPAAADL